MAEYDPSLRQKDAAGYLGVKTRTFRSYGIRADFLPGRGERRIPVYPVSRLNQFREDCNNPKSRKTA